MLKETGIQLNYDTATEITDKGEQSFALACLKVGCEVYHQIPVGTSNIDFLVINPKANPDGKLVEVTLQKRSEIQKKFVQKGKEKNKRKVLNTTGMRKQRQIESMIDSGHPWTILYNEEINRLRKQNK